MLRPAEEADEPFLLELYKLVRAPEFAPVPLPPEQLDMLLTMQYSARTGSYRASYPESHNCVVMSGETPIGQLWVDRSTAGIRVIDIALMPGHRSSGVGTALLKDLIAEAEKAGTPLTCSVATNNPGSLRFHRRLGFEVISEDPMYYELAYRGSGAGG